MSNINNYFSELESEFPGWSFSPGINHLEVVVTSKTDATTGTVRSWYGRHTATSHDGRRLESQNKLEAVEHIAGVPWMSKPILQTWSLGADRASVRFMSKRGQLTFKFYAPADIESVNADGQWVMVQAKGDWLTKSYPSPEQARIAAEEIARWTDGSARGETRAPNEQS